MQTSFGRSLARLWRLTTAVGALATLLASPAAQAVPSFARQTGSSCADCHIGSFGAHLTPYGIRFKLGGYLDSDGKGGKIPLSAQLTWSASNPAMGDVDTRLGIADVYLAGKLFGNVGTYTGIRHSEGVGTPEYTALNDMDVRWTNETELGGKPLILGLSLNNHPGVTDPIDALPAWGFGAFGFGRDVVVGTPSGSLLNQYNTGLAHRVLGLSAIASLDKHWYGEIASYRSMSPGGQNAIGQPLTSDSSGDPGKLGGNLYVRAAYMHDMKTQFFSVGLVGFHTKIQPRTTTLPAFSLQRSGPDDKVTDVGIDAMYEYLGTREHTLQLRGSHIVEKRSYGSNLVYPAVPNTPLDGSNPATQQFGQSKGTLRETTVAANYSFRNAWSITLARTWLKGSADPGRFSFNGAPDTTATFINPYWTVWGQEDSAVPNSVNLQLGMLWIRWTKINNTTGASVFGPGSFSPRDFNQSSIYARLAF